MTEKERLIDLVRGYFIGVGDTFSNDTIANLADYLVANGVRIPVRCEECVHRQKVITINNRSYVSCRHCGEIKEIGDFCKHGEKRDDNERQ